jgi:hypothetical protein
MALSGKYGKISVGKLGEDEPVFILRARDKLALPALEMYKALASSHDAKVVGSLQQEIDAFRRWKGDKKLPD